MSGGELTLRVMISGTGKCYIMSLFFVKYKAASALLKNSPWWESWFSSDCHISKHRVVAVTPPWLAKCTATFWFISTPSCLCFAPFPLALSGNKLSYQHLEVLCICYTLHVWMGKSHRSQSLYVCIFRSSALPILRKKQKSKENPIWFVLLCPGLRLLWTLRTVLEMCVSFIALFQAAGRRRGALD